ncbi:MAG: AsmA family protein [Chlamydiae bacterium]|nr:AsmA family protein [Chlamydiota bacterium]MBI3277600.1 AsmA family protein [Chlamydiota bacterium]
MKTLMQILVGMIVLFSILFVTAQIVINRPFFCEKITHALSEKLHRQVSLEGLSLSVFPSIGLHLKEFKILEKNKSDVFARLGDLQIRAKFFPLFKKQVIVNDIIIEEPEMNIVKESQGIFNFSDLVSSSPAPSTPSTPAKGILERSSSPRTVSVGKIHINNAKFSYKEVLPSGETQLFEIKGLDIHIDHFSLTDPVQVRAVSSSGKASLKGIGLSRYDLEKTLTGHAKLESKEGKILGKNITQEILSKMNQPILIKFLPGLAKLIQERDQVLPETRFTDFVVDLDIGNGKINLEKAGLTTADLSLRASGPIDFSFQANLGAHIVFSKELTEKMTQGQDLSNKLPYENGGLHIPVRITGPLSKPVIVPDLGVILSTLTKGELSDKIGGFLRGGKGKK